MGQDASVGQMRSSFHERHVLGWHCSKNMFPRCRDAQDTLTDKINNFGFIFDWKIEITMSYCANAKTRFFEVQKKNPMN